MPKERQQAILRHLLTTRAQSLYAFYDAAQEPQLLGELADSGAEFACLYSGVKAITLSDVAPYLISCRPFHTDPDRFIQSYWQRGITMLAESTEDFEQTRLQFKKNTYLQNSNGATCYFRFYDARAFSHFIRIATEPQLLSLFGNDIKTIYWLDSETQEIIGLRRQETSLVNRLLRLSPEFEIHHPA